MTRPVCCVLVFLLGVVVACDEERAPPKDDPAPAEPAAAAPEPAAPTKAAPAAGASSPDAGVAAAPAAEPAAAAPTFEVGDKVSGKWTNGQWYPGTIGAVNPDGTYRVNYNDGDVSKRLPASKIRPRKASAKKSSGDGCPSGHMKCGGRCVDYRNDPKNCNACGRQCPEACHNAMCVSNEYKYGG